MNNTQEFLDFLIHTSLDQRSTGDLQRFGDVISITLQLHDIDPVDLNILSSESHLYHLGKGIAFLQGESASAYFIVMRGTMKLFYETDIRLEQERIEKFGDFKDKLNLVIDETNMLGTCIEDLKKGDSFGEHAILAEEILHSKVKEQYSSFVNSPRSPRSPRGRIGVLEQKGLSSALVASRVTGQPYSAIGLEEETLLLAIPADTYRRTLQKHHIVQRELVKKAMALWEIPLFTQASFAKVCNLAHSIDIQKYTYKHMLAEYAQEIQYVYLILKGHVKVSAPLLSILSTYQQAADIPKDDSNLYESTTNTLISPTLPLIPSVDVLQPSQIVGEVEVSKGLTAFRFHYTAQTLHTEVIVMPIHLYIECMREYMIDCKDLMHVNVTVLPAEERALRMDLRHTRLREIKLLSLMLSGKNMSIAYSSMVSSTDKPDYFINSVVVDVGNHTGYSGWGQFRTQQSSIISSDMCSAGSVQSPLFSYRYPSTQPVQPSCSRPSPIKRAPGRQRKHITTTSSTGSSCVQHQQQSTQKQQTVRKNDPKQALQTDPCLTHNPNNDDINNNTVCINKDVASSFIGSGPSACMEYAATMEEAAVRVTETLRNIRKRVYARKENAL